MERVQFSVVSSLRSHSRSSCLLWCCSVGYGAILVKDWLAGRWSPLQMPLSIAYIELFPIVLAASLWGHPWFAKRVDFCFDNKAMVEVLRSHTSRDSNLMVLLRHLSLLAPRHSFVFASRHIPGKSNAVADAISRFAFRRVPSAGALCVSHSNTSNPFGPSPAACNLDQKCQLYLSNGLATSTRRVYRSAQRQFIGFCTLEAVSLQMVLYCPLMNKPCFVIVPTERIVYITP